MAKIYRLWGHIRGKQVTEIISATIPPEIAGVCKKVSSDMVALLIASKIEDAHRDSQALGGIVIDLMKCYNTVPRGALLKILVKLGVPPNVCNAFRAMMKQMCRFFEVAQCCSLPQTTTTGIIEGCGFAIPSMLALRILAHAAVVEYAANAQCAFFADNWSVCASSFEDLQKSLLALEETTNTLRMKIAPKKSWSWATTVRLRKQCAQLQVESCPIPLVQSAHDLGMQQNYSKKKSKKTIKAKIQKAKSKLGIIKKTKIPRGMKERVAASAGHACVSYAGVFQQLTPQEYHTIRSDTAQAIQCAGSGANSYLACNARNPSLDPEFKLLFLRFQLWKRFSKIFPGKAALLHEKCQKIQNCPAMLKMPGPLSAFVHAVTMIGCKFNETPGVMHIANRECRWMDVSSKVLKALLQSAWIQHVAISRIKRKHFNISSFDWEGNQKAVGKMTYHQKALVAIYQTGRHITNDALSKFLHGVDSCCTLCGAQDSREHRLFHCEALNDIRPNQQTMLRVRKTWKEANWYFGLTPAIPDPSQVIGSVTNQKLVLEKPEKNTVLHTVFTDGSAFFGDIPALTLAAGAVIEVSATDNIIHSLHSGIVPGCEQHSFAGELFAVLLALNKYFHVHVYTDCQAVVDLVDSELRGKITKPELHGCRDIWRLVKKHLDEKEDRHITITKVKAHAQLCDTMSDTEKWKIWANAKADATAKNEIQIKNKKVFQILEKMHKQTLQQRQDSVEILSFVAAASQRCLRKQTAMHKERQKQVVVDFNQPGLEEPLQTKTLQFEFSFLQHQAYPWGPVYLWRILYWARKLQWDVHEIETGADISFLELFIDFVLTTGTCTPVNIFTKAQRDRFTAPCYVLQVLQVRADCQAVTLGSQTQVWTKSLCWLMQHSPIKNFLCKYEKNHGQLTFWVAPRL